MKIDKNIAEKALAKMSEIEHGLLYTIINKIVHEVTYAGNRSDEERLTFLKNIADTDKWDYIGLMSKEQKAQYELLNHLINENSDHVQEIKFM